MISRLREILKPRWKFLLYGYFLGYGLSLYKTGVPNIYYLIPIKGSAVLIGWAMGNAFYHGLNNPGNKRAYYAVIHTFISVLLMGITFLLIDTVCGTLNIDPVPFYGFE